MSTAAIKGRYSLVPPVAADGQFPFILTDAAGRILVASAASTGGLTNYNQAAANDRVVSATPTRPLLFFGRSVAAVTIYFMVFDAAVIPVVNGTAPIMTPLQVLAGAHFSLALEPVPTAVGLVWASSTTDVTLTLSGGADLLVTTQHLP